MKQIVTEESRDLTMNGKPMGSPIQALWIPTLYLDLSLNHSLIVSRPQALLPIYKLYFQLSLKLSLSSAFSKKASLKLWNKQTSMILWEPNSVSENPFMDKMEKIWGWCEEWWKSQIFIDNVLSVILLLLHLSKARIWCKPSLNI